MFYAQTKANKATKTTKKAEAAVVYVLAFEGAKAIVLTEAGLIQAVPLADIQVLDANRVTPFPSWPAVVEA